MKKLSIEKLEPRIVLYNLSGYSWPDVNLNYSFIPDGVIVDGQVNTLFSTLSKNASIDAWQKEIAQGLQQWANNSNLNFALVPDNESVDIRISAILLSNSSWIAYAYYPTYGDMSFNNTKNWNIDSNYDIFSVFMHEAGHSIGLGHSDAGTVMDAYYRGVQTGLKADDIAGVQALYGARTEDVYDLTLRNDTKESASTVGDLDTFADLTTQSDVDWWKVVVPDINNGSMIVNINVREHSLLAPSLKIYDVDNNLVADLTNTYGQSVSFTINNVVAGQVYYLLVDGASTDEFGMGKYNIIVDFGNGGNNDIIQPDRFEPNDSINLASNLGRINNINVLDLTTHTTTDIDFYTFTSNKSGLYTISTNFAKDTSYTIQIYDAQGNIIVDKVNSSASLSLSSKQKIYIKVLSDSINTYTLSIARKNVSNRMIEEYKTDKPQIKILKTEYIETVDNNFIVKPIIFMNNTLINSSSCDELFSSGDYNNEEDNYDFISDDYWKCCLLC